MLNRYSDGGFRYSEGGFRYSDSGFCYSDGGFRYCDGGLHYSDLRYCHGGLRYCHGAFRYSALLTLLLGLVLHPCYIDIIMFCNILLTIKLQMEEWLDMFMLDTV